MRFFNFNRSKTGLQDFRAARPASRESLFVVEALEPRILLSAAPAYVPDPGFDAAANEPVAPVQDATATHEEHVQWEDTTQNQDGAAAQSTVDAEFLFGQTESLAPLESGPEATPLTEAIEAPVAPITPPVDTVLPDAEEDEITPVNGATEVNIAAPLVGNSSGFDSSIVTGSESNIVLPPANLDTNPIVEQLTDSLVAANAPPAATIDTQATTADSLNTTTPPPSGDGSLLSGANTQNTAPVTTAAGQIIHLTTGQTLDANGELIVGQGDTLNGSGTIDGSVVIDGIFSPGNSPGIVNITGNLTVGAGTLDPEPPSPIRVNLSVEGPLGIEIWTFAPVIAAVFH